MFSYFIYDPCFLFLQRNYLLPSAGTFLSSEHYGRIKCANIFATNFAKTGPPREPFVTGLYIGNKVKTVGLTTFHTDWFAPQWNWFNFYCSTFLVYLYILYGGIVWKERLAHMCCNVHKNDFTPTPFLKILFVVAYLHCAENLILLILLNKFSKNKITYHIGS